MNPSLNKIVENFNNLNDQMRYAVLAGVVVFIILLDGFLLVGPQIGAISDTNDQIKKLTDDTQQVLVDKRQSGIAKKNLRIARRQLGSLSLKVRPIQEVPVILSNISSIAKDYGVKIDQLIPEYNQLEPLNVPSENKYYALPVLIKAVSGYHNFGHFLNKVENSNLSLVMKDFIIENEDKNPNAHSFSLTIKIILMD